MRRPQAKPEAAREAARELIRQFGVTQPPVPVDDIARRLGVSVEYSPFEQDLSGMAHVKAGAPIVGVNSLHHKNRQRFTLSHELAHVCLHRPFLETVVHVDKGSLRRDAVSAMGTEAIEIEANAFASELLIPRSLLDAEIAGRNIDLEDDLAVEQLAKRFHVSVAAMRFRLQG